MRSLTRIFLAVSLLLATAASTALVAQRVRFGFRAGLSTAAVPTTEREVMARGQAFRLAVDDIPLGFHVGLVVQARARNWVLQPELLFHSTRTDYRLSELSGPSLVESIRSERFSHAELPLLVAYRWGPLRLQGGPTARVLLASSSELEGVGDYLNAPERYALGYQVGIGFDIRRVVLDIKYDGSFSGLGSNIVLGGESLSFNENAGRTYVSLGLLLFGK